MASSTASLRTFQRALSPLVWAALVAILASLILVVAWVEMPFGELSVLIAYLGLSSIASSIVGFLAYRLSEAGRRSIRTKVLVAHGLGALIVIANIFVTAQLMFFSTHDLGLLMLALVFCALFSVTFGAGIASRMTTAVERLSEGAMSVAKGDYATRVDVHTNDELADLAASFNTMVARVNESAESQRRAETSRRALIAAVSHDLRTPLTAIRAMLEALSDGVVDDPETVSRYHHTMRTQVEHLSRLIDDLFEVSQLDAGGQRYDLRRTDLVSVIGDVVEGFAMTAAGRGVEIGFDAPGQVWVSIEAGKIARVANNLLDNALRYAPDGSSIDVTVEEANNEAIVTVRDHGDGVSDDDLPHVFEQFYRGEKSRSRVYGGAGLGLAIARGIVTGHGGRIWVSNKPDGGAAFTFTIPLNPVWR